MSVDDGPTSSHLEVTSYKMPGKEEHDHEDSKHGKQVPRSEDKTILKRKANEVIQEIDKKIKLVSESKTSIEHEKSACKGNMEYHKYNIFEQIQQEHDGNVDCLNTICTKKKEVIERKVNNLDYQRKVLKMVIEKIDDAYETEALESHKKTIDETEKEVNKYSDLEENFSSEFISNEYLHIHLGILIIDDGRYIIDKNDKSFSVTIGQPFEVNVERRDGSNTDTLVATLIYLSSVEKCPTDDVERLERGKYRIKGRCNKEGKCILAITEGVNHVKVSQINVVQLGCVLTIPTTPDIQCLTDVILDTNDRMLVSRKSNQLMICNQSKDYRRESQGVGLKINKMYPISGGRIVCSDKKKERVVILNDKFEKEEDAEFTTEDMESPEGLTVNNASRVLYVADTAAHCIFRFHIDNKTQMRPIGSMGSKNNQLCQPHDVTLTKQGNLMVTDYGNHRVQMFDANGTFFKTIISKGENDGYVMCPNSIVIDNDGNVIVSSQHKLQVFDQTGHFIKRIDSIDDGLDHPHAIRVVSNRPRRLAVINSGENNVKLYNY